MQRNLRICAPIIKLLSLLTMTWSVSIYVYPQVAVTPLIIIKITSVDFSNYRWELDNSLTPLLRGMEVTSHFLTNCSSIASSIVWYLRLRINSTLKMKINFHLATIQEEFPNWFSSFQSQYSIHLFHLSTCVDRYHRHSTGAHYTIQLHYTSTPILFSSSLRNSDQTNLIAITAATTADAQIFTNIHFAVLRSRTATHTLQWKY